MLLAYVFRTGTEPRPELCVLASKPDSYSVPVNVFCLPVTDNAVIRMGPTEALLAALDPSDRRALIITPVKPSKLFITPSQADRVGEQALNIKIVRLSEDNFQVFFQRETEVQRNEWKQWLPNVVARTA